MEVGGGPQVGIDHLTRKRAAQSGQWIVSWRLRNEAAEPLTIDAAWLPHGQFRGDRTELRPPLSLPPGQAAELDLPVHWDETAARIENAFLILTVHWRGEPWQILARLTIEVGSDAGPDAQPQNMTVQRVGFSQRQEGRGPVE
jgi:hypothetical protein